MLFRSLKEGLLIQNNTQKDALVFFPKQILRQALVDNSKPAGKRDIDDPTAVREALGQLVLVGDIVRYIERVRVVSSLPPSAPTVRDDVIRVEQGQSSPLEIAGAVSADKAKTELIPEKEGLSTQGLMVDFKTDEEGLHGRLDVAENVTPGRYTIVFKKADGKTEVARKSLVVKQGGPPEIKDKGLSGTPEACKKEEDKEKYNCYRIEISGKYLETATLQETLPASENVVVDKDSVQPAANTITAVLKVKKNAPEHTYALKIYTDWGQTLHLDFNYTPPK